MYLPQGFWAGFFLSLSHYGKHADDGAHSRKQENHRQNGFNQKKGHLFSLL